MPTKPKTYKLEYKWGKVVIKAIITIQKSPDGKRETHHLRVGAKTIGYFKRGVANPEGETSLGEQPLKPIGNGNLLAGVLLWFALKQIKNEENQIPEYRDFF